MERNGHIMFPTVEFGLKFEDEPKITNGYHHKEKEKPDSNTSEQRNGKDSSLPGRRKATQALTTLSQCLFGHAPYVTQILTENQYSLKWFPLAVAMAVESICRSVSNVALASNPLSGLLILTAMFIAAPKTLVMACVALCSGIFTSIWIVRIPLLIVRSGGITFNCFLMGIVIGEVASNSVLTEKPDVIIVCIFSGALTIIAWCGLNGLLSQCDLPVLNAPVNVLAILYISSGLASRYEANSSEGAFGGLAVQTLPSEFGENINGTMLNSSVTPYFVNPNNGAANQPPEETNKIIWHKVFGGVIFAPNQIFATNSPATASMVYIAMFIYSPMLFVEAIVGATIGTVIGVGLSEPPYTTIYNGGWAYNPLLTQCALGGLFLIFNMQSCAIAITGAGLTAITYSVLERGGKPILGLPFNLMTWLILPVVSNHSHRQNGKAREEESDSHSSFCQSISRVPLDEMTTPEIHLQTKAKYSRPWQNSVGPGPPTASSA